MIHTLFVPGKPEPHPRPRRGARGQFYTPRTAWSEKVTITARFNRPTPALYGPVNLDLIFFFARPKTILPSVVWMDRRPDRDNLDKAILDALTNAGWWKDDCCVVSGIIAKRWNTYKSESGVVIMAKSASEAEK